MDDTYFLDGDFFYLVSDFDLFDRQCELELDEDNEQSYYNATSRFTNLQRYVTKVIEYVTNIMQNNTMFKDLCKSSKLRLFHECYMNSNYYKEQDLALEVAEERGRSNNDTKDQTTVEAIKALSEMEKLLDLIDAYEFNNNNEVK